MQAQKLSDLTSAQLEWLGEHITYHVTPNPDNTMIADLLLCEETREDLHAKFYLRNTASDNEGADIIVNIDPESPITTNEQTGAVQIKIQATRIIDDHHFETIVWAKLNAEQTTELEQA